MVGSSWEVTFIGVEDALDVISAPQVHERLRDLLERRGPVALDLRSVSLDSAGLGAVLSLQRRLELQNRRLIVVADDDYLDRLLEATGVGKMLCVVRDADEAVRRARLCSLVAA
jgi:anti-anti-sigma factor